MRDLRATLAPLALCKNAVALSALPWHFCEPTPIRKGWLHCIVIIAYYIKMGLKWGPNSAFKYTLKNILIFI
jgi:hypothetical protein